MASLKDIEKVTDELEDLVGQFRKELTNGEVDFGRLIEIADEISERADGVAGTFATMNEALSSRIGDLKERSGGGGSKRSSSGRSRSKSGSKS